MAMAKPTLFQSLLGRPSQSYHFPPSKEYYSTKPDLMRVATETSPAPDIAPRTAPVLGPGSDYEQKSSASESSFPSQGRPSSPRRRPAREAEVSVQATNPQTEPTAITSSASTLPTSVPGDLTPRHSSLSGSLRNSYEDRSGKQTPLTNGHEGDNEASLGEESGSTTDEEDVFYTPRSSLYSSPRTSRHSDNMLIDPKALAYALLPLPSSPLATPKSSLSSKLDGIPPHGVLGADELPISRTSSESSFTSSTSSSSTEETMRTHGSSLSHSTTTRATSPLTSERSTADRANEVSTITIARSHARSASTPQPIRGQPRPLAATRQRRRSQQEIKRQTYTDEDWAKEVRWLAPVDPSKPDSPRRHSPRKLPRELLGPTDLLPPANLPPPRHPPQYRIPNSYPPPARSAEHRERKARRSRGSRSSRGRMSALLEEDESEYSDLTTTSSSAEPSRAPSPVLEEPEESRSLPNSPLSGSMIRSTSQRSGKDHSSDDAAESPDARVQAYATSNGQRRRAYSHTYRLSRSISPTAFTYSQNLPTQPLPTPTPAPSTTPNGNGYSTLTLPRATYSGNGKVSGFVDGKLDLVRAGIAHSSMATVEVTRGVAQASPSSDVKRKRRAMSLSFSLKFLDGLGKGKGKGKEAQTPAHLIDALPLPVEFTSHLPPPSYIPSQHVLLQVYAVGIDGLDSVLVHEKASSNGKGAGFVPGRSVVGKVIEVGWEVKEDVCRRGEWVVGLLDVRKVGSAQLIHRDLLASSSLSVEELALLPLCALQAHRAVRTFADVISPSKPRLDTDPSRIYRPRVFVLQGHDGAGAMAVQMLARRGVRVCVQVPDSAARDDHNEGDEDDSPSGAVKGKAKQTKYDRLDARLRSWGAEEIRVGEPLEVLERFVEEGRSFDAILDTVGGVAVWEQSMRVLLADPETDPTSRTSPTPNTPGTTKSYPSVASSKGSRASSSSNKRNLVVTQFTTLVGDTPSRPIPTAQDNFRSGFRSLKRTVSAGSRARSHSPAASGGTGSTATLPASASKDSLLMRRNTTNGQANKPKRTVSYAWVCAAADVDFEGEDVRDSLGAVVSMVEEGWIRPWLGDEADGSKIVPFDKAPELFRRHGDSAVGLLKDGGTAVVRVAS
ncbi:hypothetical protein EIP86_010304 [Pleurotus ostreatoroseus]|nr:hypothetical protein EIP86_010304 [Pleurotus ostreatoroseus]